VAFLAVNVIVAPLLLAVGALPLSLVFRSLFGGVWSLLALPVAALAAGLIPRVAIWTARLKAEIDSWFLGADRLAAAEARVSALSTQRQEILDAVAAERRRIERNLHDGVQQQLVAIGVDLGIAARHVDDDPEQARQLIDSARGKVQASIGELRQLGRGLHPSILEDRGLDAALSAVVAGSPIPISVQVDPDLDLSTDVAEVLYFVANEAIANVLKHSRARVASIHVAKVAANVRLTVHDDGVGGADPGAGTGLAGIRARVHAIDGAWSLTSPAGGPTTLVVEVPRHG
jgi:signal transduction histidine kinase